jgi:hypothetical protein
LRSQKVDLSRTLTVAPVFTKAPEINKSGLLHVQGLFPLRPVHINFELLFQPVNGQWRMFGISVNPTLAPALSADAPTTPNTQSIGAVQNVAGQSTPSTHPATDGLARYMPEFVQHSGINPWVLLAFAGLAILAILALIRQMVLLRRSRKEESLMEYHQHSDDDFHEPRMPPPA